MSINTKYSSRQSGGSDIDPGALQQMVRDAQTAATDASADEVLAYRYANELPGVDIAPGVKSSRHYSEQARLSAVSGGLVPTTTVDTAASPYTLTASDLKRKIKLTGTTGTLVLPRGLGGSASAADGGPGMDWASFVNRSSGAWAWSAGVSATVAPPVLAVQVFPFTTSVPAAGVASSFSLTAPAGTGRKVTFFLFSIFNTTDGARNVTLTVGSSSNLSKAQADTTTARYDAVNPINASAWTCDLADSASVATTHALVLTASLAVSFVLCAFVTSGTTALAGVAGVTPSSPAVTNSVAKTPSEANDIIMFGLAMQGTDAQPTTLSGGGSPTQSYNANTGGAAANRPLKDIAYIFGYEARANTSAQTYTQTSAKSANSASLVALARPVAGAVAVLNPTSPTSLAAGKHATAWADPDGTTWDVEV
jgi:hypothetical protein